MAGSHVASLTPEQRALCLAARTAPSDAARADLAAVLGGELDWERLWALAHLHEVGPVVGRNVIAVGGDAVPAEWRERALRRRHVTMRVNGNLAEALLSVVGAMAERGVEAMPVKGLVLAENLYGDIAARPCADLDVLVRSADLDTAGEALRSVGFTQIPRPPYKALVHQFHQPAWIRGSGPDHIRLELHWALWADSERRLGTDGLWARATDATINGQPVRSLSPEDMLLHLAIHRTRSALRLRWIVDVAELLRRHGATLDWDAFLDRARQAGGRTASWMVLSLAKDLLDAPVPDTVMRQLRVAWPKRALLERTCGVPALFHPAADGNVAQQPHLVLRAFEEDGVRHIGSSIARSVVRPIREALHVAGVIRARRTVPEVRS